MKSTNRRPLKKRPLYRDEIKNSIKQAIVTGELQPGDRIVETRWAKELGVSQSPVREAIRELEMIGLVENIPYQGSFVRKVTKKDMKDSYKVRMHLEMLGIEDAVNIITDEEIEEVYRTLKEMETAAEEQDFDLYVQKDVLFHQKIMEISQNTFLLRFWKQSNMQLQGLVYFGTWYSGQTLKELSTRHDDLYVAIKTKDIKRGKVAVRRHYEELIRELDTNRKL